LGSGLPGEVRTLIKVGSNLFAGGLISGGISRWNGTAWSSLGTGMNGSVNRLAIGGSDLYAVGSFTTAGGGSANRIAKWNGTAWSALGTGLDDYTIAILIDGTDIYAGGYFTTAGGVSAIGIARWNGVVWSPVGSGINGSVLDLRKIGDYIYAAGIFQSVGILDANNVARWDGSSWSAVGGSGIIGSFVYEMLPLNDDLFFAGAFNVAGGHPSFNIARYNENLTSAEEDITQPAGYSLFQNYPNPFNPVTSINYQIPEEGMVSLKVYDMLGREITTLVNEYKSSGKYNVEFNGSGLSSGVYIYKLYVNNKVFTKKLLLMK
jgi:hypothetical protein